MARSSARNVPRATTGPGRDRRVALLGVLAVAIGWLCAALLAALSLRWSGTADSYEHLDYVYQVYLGHLPEPTGHRLDASLWGIVGERVTDGRQYASAHPPLYYWIGAVLVGPLLDQGRLVLAVALLRGLNVVFGLGGLLALAWGGWVIGGRWRAALAISVPMIGTMTYAYLRFAGEVYNDMLITAVSITTIVVGIRVLQVGPRPLLVVAISVLSALGMGTKATFVVVLALAAGAVFVGSMLHATGRPARRILPSIALAAAPILTAAVAFGWFYVRNQALSGAWYRSTESASVGGRPYRSLGTNLADPHFYGIVPEGLFGKWAKTVVAAAPSISLWLFLAGALTTIIVFAILLRRRVVRPDAAAAWTAALLAAHLLGQYAMQLSHATGYGQYNFRYFLPATLSFSVLMVAGVVVYRAARTVAVPLAAGIILSMSLLSMAALAVGADALRRDPIGELATIGAAGVPHAALVALLAGAFSGIVAAAVALWHAGLPRDLRARGTVDVGAGDDRPAPALTPR